jgi:hypothetical protein
VPEPQRPAMHPAVTRVRCRTEANRGCARMPPVFANLSVMRLKVLLATSESRTSASSAACNDSPSRASCGTRLTSNLAPSDGAPAMWRPWPAGCHCGPGATDRTRHRKSNHLSRHLRGP